MIIAKLFKSKNFYVKNVNKEKYRYNVVISLCVYTKAIGRQQMYTLPLAKMQAINHYIIGYPSIYEFAKRDSIVDYLL